MTKDRYLFRGFHKEENGKETIYIDGQPIKGKWVYGDLHQDFAEKHNYYIAYSDCNEVGDVYYTRTEVIPETIGQWTGLEDINRKKIFENDNLKMFQIDYDSETENGYGESTFEYKEIHIKATLDFIYSYEFYEEFLDEFEIIGTIFDKEVNDNE